jgi:outer membrane protein, heavy metal efflux system
MKVTKLWLVPALGFSLVACQTAAPPSSREEVVQALLPKRTVLVATPATAAVAPTRTDANTPMSDSALMNPLQAQQLALLYSPQIQLMLAELDIQDARLWQQTLMQNPGFGVSLMRPEDGGRWKLGFRVNLVLLDWLSRNQRVNLADAEHHTWQARTLTRLDEELQDINRHWFDAVAARHNVTVHRELLESASVAAELARLLYEAGNISELEMLTHSSAESRQQQHLRDAQLNAQQSLSRLLLRVGLSEDGNVELPETLPVPEPQIQQLRNTFTPETLLATAREHQPALELQRRELSQQEQQLQLTERRIALRQAGLELETERESSGERSHGFSIDLAPPVFDNGDAALTAVHTARARTALMMDWHIRHTDSQIRQTLASLDNAMQQLEQLEQHDLPRYERMLQLALQQYNFMLSGSFDLLTIKDLALSARLEHVAALQQFWIAMSELSRLTGTDMITEEPDHD